MLVNFTPACLLFHVTALSESTSTPLSSASAATLSWPCARPCRLGEAREKDPSRQLVSIGETLESRPGDGNLRRLPSHAFERSEATKNQETAWRAGALPSQKRVLQEQPYALMRYLPQPTYGRRNERQENDAKCVSCPDGGQASLLVSQPAGGCAICHMPKQQIKTIPYALYHNHWIEEEGCLTRKKSLSAAPCVGRSERLAFR